MSTVLFHPIRPEEAYSSQAGRVFRSLDGGEHWSALDQPGGDGLYPSALLISPNQPTRLVAMFLKGQHLKLQLLQSIGQESPEKDKNIGENTLIFLEQIWKIPARSSLMRPVLMVPAQAQTKSHHQ